MRCAFCGHEGVSGERFCEVCGKPLEKPLDPGSAQDGAPAQRESALTPEAGHSRSSANRLTPAQANRPAGSRPNLLWAALGIVLYLAIVAAAVEVFRHHAPTRWWMVGAAALYLVLSAATWRLAPPRWRWPTWEARAIISLAVLLAGLVFVWRSRAAGGAMQMADASVVAPLGSGDAPPSSDGTTGPADSAGYQLMSEQLNHLNAAVDVLNGKVNRSLFEIDALADTLGSNPTTIFHFVRDQIRYQPYVGALRGALGTLVCRAGNSLDRSLLLAALLQKAGFTVQIANGTLSAADARVLVQRTFERPKPTPSAIADPTGLIPDLAQALGVDGAKVRQAAQQDSANTVLGRARVLAYTDSEGQVVSTLLSQAHVDPAVLTPVERLVAEARDHYWMQYQDSSGKWIDLDPAFATAEPGQTRTAAARTFGPDAVPDTLYHRLRITLMLRVASASGSDTGSDQVLLDQDLRIADVQGKAVTVMSQPVPRVDPLKPGVTRMDVVDAAKVYQTMLVVGDEQTKGKGFDLSGHVGDVASPDGLGSDNGVNAGNANRGLFGAISGAVSGDTAPKSEGRIVGEWVDYTLTSPGLSGAAPEAHAYRRNIIAPVTVTSWTPGRSDGARTTPTHLGLEALRRGLAWSGSLLPVTGTPRADYASYLSLQALIASRATIDVLDKAQHGFPIDPGALTPVPQAPAASILIAGPAMHWLGHDGSQSVALKSYFAEPGLIAYEQAIADSAGQSGRREGFDIVSFSPRTVADPAAGAADARMRARSLRVRRGVLATRLEALLSARDVGSLERVANTTNVFAAAQRQGIPIVVLPPGDAGRSQLARLGTSDAVKAELAEDLGAGQMVIIPSRSVATQGLGQIGWWRWRTESGELLGVMPGERGQAYVEYGLQMVNGGICAYKAAQAAQNNFAEGLIGLFGCELGPAMAPGAAWMFELDEEGKNMVEILVLSIELMVDLGEMNDVLSGEGS